MAEVVHMCPPYGSDIMPCCDRSPLEVPLDDRMTMDGALVTCWKKEKEDEGDQ